MCDHQDQSIEEYRALHDQWESTKSHRERARNYAITLFIGLIGYGMVHNYPWLYVIAWGVTVIYWFEFQDANDKMAQISRYVEVFFERDSRQLRWHGRADRIKSKVEEADPSLRQTVHKCRKEYLTPHMLMFVVSGFLSVHAAATMYLGTLSENWNVCSAILSVVSVIVLYFLFAKFIVQSWAGRRVQWREVWDEMNAEENDKGGA